MQQVGLPLLMELGRVHMLRSRISWESGKYSKFEVVASTYIVYINNNRRFFGVL